jgi:TRAP-type C4-dicarboxylate transport system permease small subunit
MVAEQNAASSRSSVMRLFRTIALVLRALLGLVLIGLVFLNVANAVARATGTVVIGVDEVLVFGMIWMVMLGMLLVTAERGHINFELVTSRVGPRMQVILMVVTHLILSASCAYAAWQSFLYVSQITRLGQTSMALGMPMLIPHSAVVVGFGGTAIIAAILAIGGIRQLVSGEGLEEQVAS